MIVKNEPYLIEYNVRMGDPECQTILPKLKTDIIEIFLACCEQKLSKINIEWSNKKSLCIVLCSNGYPEGYKKNVRIDNIEKIILNENEYLYHAGTIKRGMEFYAIGGRVLNFVTLSDNYELARRKIIQKLQILKWLGGFYRKDICHKDIKT